MLVERLDGDPVALEAMQSQPPIAAGRLPDAFSWHPRVRTGHAPSRVAQALRLAFAQLRPDLELSAPPVGTITCHGPNPDRTLAFRPRWKHAFQAMVTGSRNISDGATLGFSRWAPGDGVEYPPGSAASLLLEATCEVLAPLRLQGPVEVFAPCNITEADFESYTHLTGRLWPVQAANMEAPRVVEEPVRRVQMVSWVSLPTWTAVRPRRTQTPRRISRSRRRC